MTKRIDQFLAIIAAWKRKDIEAVLAAMSDDIVWHYAAAAQPALVGKAAARKFLTRFAADLAEVRWRIFSSAETGDRLFVEGVDEYVTPKGAVVIAPYAGVIEFTGDLVSGWRDYVDVGVIAAQRGGEPATKQVTELASRPSL